MQASDAAKELIKEFEGCSLQAYLCPAKVWTIGYGATGQHVRKGVIWSLEMAEKDLDARLFVLSSRLWHHLIKHHSGKTSQPQFDALISFAYNFGIRALLDSTLFHHHLEADYSAAAKEFGKWIYAGTPKKKLPGLVRRREAEAALYWRGS